MTSNWVADIENLHYKFGVHGAIENFDKEKMWKLLQFRRDFLKEEYKETSDAVDAYDVEEIIDGLIDLCVVAIGTLDLMGVDPYVAWNRVHRANMSKEVGIKPSRPNPLGLPDLIKPEGWEAPSHKDNHGFFGDNK